MSADSAKNEHQAHLSNYRMAFDAMRAYHLSEIEHKKDMIAILNSILISIITVFAGIFYFILSPGYDKYKAISVIVVIVIAALYCILIKKLNYAHITKLRGDHDRYEKFRTECQLERNFLGLNQYFENIEKVDVIYWDIIDNSDKPKNGEKRDSGVIKTISIIIIYSDLLFYIVLCLSTISLAILVSQTYIF